MKRRIDWPFYRYVLALALPIMLQNGVTTFVGLLDNIMVGSIGTEQMSGVAIVNQLLFVVNMTLFGSTAGAGLFISQFRGSGNEEGERQAFRMKLMTCLSVSVLGITLLVLLRDPLIGAWLHDTGSGDLELTRKSAEEYFSVILVGLIPFAVKEAYSTTLRETGQTVVPMKAALVAVFVNLALNYILIFGKLGMPAMGVRGAALATVVSRVAECAVVVLWTHRHRNGHCRYIRGAYRSLHVRRALAADILRKGLPLTFNEICWACAKAMLSRCYSERGLDAVASFNIATAVNDVTSVVFIALGVTTAIVLGNTLGAGKAEEARKSAPRLILFNALLSGCIGIVQMLLSPLFPQLYNTTDEIRHLAAQIILWHGCLQPIFAVCICEYYTLRSGGNVLITLIFDSAYEWLIAVPVAALLIFRTSLPLVTVYAIVNGVQITKVIFGAILVKRGKWVRNLAQQYE